MARPPRTSVCPCPFCKATTTRQGTFSGAAGCCCAGRRGTFTGQPTGIATRTGLVLHYQQDAGTGPGSHWLFDEPPASEDPTNSTGADECLSLSRRRQISLTMHIPKAASSLACARVRHYPQLGRFMTHDVGWDAMNASLLAFVFHPYPVFSWSYLTSFPFVLVQVEM